MLGATTNAWAHDPGLSTTDLKFESGQLTAHLTCARAEIERLVILDPDNDGVVSDVELAMARDPLESLIPDLIAIGVDGRPARASLTSFRLDESDALHLRLNFKQQHGGRLSIQAPAMDKFARGHRQHITVRDMNGQVHNGILSADSNRLEFDLHQPNNWEQFRNYLHEGAWHIWTGYDHILFLLALLLPAALAVSNGHWHARDDFKSTALEVVKIVSAFTVAHSITLGLAVFGLVSLPSRLVESVIAASVIFAAFNNLRPKIQHKLWLLVFLFGLIHGLGFAGVLAELGLPGEKRGWALLAFNLGVEFGQLAIVAVLFPMIYLQRQYRYYRWLYVQTGSWLIAAISSLWLVERLANVEILSWI